MAGVPRQALVVEEILRELHIDSYEPSVVQYVMDFVYSEYTYYLSDSGKILLFWPDSSQVDKYPLIQKFSVLKRKCQYFLQLKSSPIQIKPVLTIFPNVIIYLSIKFPWKSYFLENPTGSSQSGLMRPLF